MNNMNIITKQDKLNNFNNIPQEMKEYPNWVVWKLEKIEGREKLSKIPYKSATTRSKANSPLDWISYEEAVNLFTNYNFDGIGMQINLQDQFCYIDVDHTKIEDIIPTYTELSQSGEGYHYIGKCDKHDLLLELEKQGRKKGNYELYLGGRFLAITGNMVSETNEIKDITQEAINFYQKYIKTDINTQTNNITNNNHNQSPLSPQLSDDEILTIIKHAKNGEKFFAMYEGKTPLNNETDMSFVSMLSFYTQNEEQIEHMWMNSGLYRKKLDRKDYRNAIIKKVLTNLNSVYTQKNEMIIDIDDLEEEAISLHEDKIKTTIDKLKEIKEYTKDGYKITEYIPIFDVKFCEKKIKEDKKNFSTIITYQPQLCVENLETLIDYLNINLRYNLYSRETEINGFNPQTQQHLVFNLFLNFIYSQCVEWKFKGYSMQMINTIITALSMKNSYNPVSDYLDSLIPLDSLTNFNALCDTLILKEGWDEDFKKTLILTWMISLIHAGHTTIGFSSEGILILQGSQGLKKTTWFRNLFPQTFFKDGMNIDPDNKDTIIIATKYWCTELGEIGSTFKKDLNKLKATITTPQDEYRDPYGYKSIKYPRRTIFCGTVNEEFFLKDETGNRRYWILPLQNILPTHHIDMNLVWAEVLNIYNTTDPQREQRENNNEEPLGKWWLSKREEELLGDMQQEHEVQQNWETYLEANLKLHLVPTQWLTSLDIYKKLGQPSFLNAPNIGKFLSRKKIMKQTRGGGKAYYNVPNFWDDDNEWSNIPNNKNNEEIRRNLNE